VCSYFRGAADTQGSCEVVSVAEHPDEPRLQSFTVDDPRLWDVRPQLGFEELALEDVTDEEWDAFYAALAEE
jgi:hypothetical protein